MIMTIELLKMKYSTYSDIQGKIRRDIRDGHLKPIVRGLYETNSNTPGYYMSSYIYGPSYLSFEYALSYYGLIPERVTTYTSASFNKHKTKTYQTPFGNYVYKDVPSMAFPFGIRIVEENGYVYHIASKEKALCDKLYDAKPVHSVKQLRSLLFDDLRIDPNEFDTLDKHVLKQLVSKYRSNNLVLLQKLLWEEN